MFSPPAVAGDRVLVASCSGSLFGLEREDGAIAWTYDAQQDGGRPEFHGTSIVTGDTIVIATDDRRAEGIGHVHAIVVKDGKSLWSQDFGGPVTSLTDAGGEQGELYVGTTNGIVFSTR